MHSRLRWLVYLLLIVLAALATAWLVPGGSESGNAHRPGTLAPSAPQ